MAPGRANGLYVVVVGGGVQVVPFPFEAAVRSGASSLSLRFAAIGSYNVF